MAPKVLNKRTDRIPKGAVYVGRPSPFGNPFKVPKDGSRSECCQYYEAWIMNDEQKELRKRMRRELRGKDLVCWCAPKACHAYIILSIANARTKK